MNEFGIGRFRNQENAPRNTYYSLSTKCTIEMIHCSNPKQLFLGTFQDGVVGGP